MSRNRMETDHMKIEILTKCPSCGAEVVREGPRLRCPNTDGCPDQTQYRVYHYLQCLGVKGMGEKIIEKLFETRKLRHIPDLYRLTVEDIADLEGQGEKNAIKFLHDLREKSRNIPLPVFVKSLGMPLFGESFTEIVMEKLPTLAGMRKAKVSDVENINRIGPAVAQAMVDGFKRNSEIIDELLKHVSIEKFEKVEGGTLSGKSFCFTGYRSAEAEAKIKAQGGTIASGVSKNTSYLVTKDAGSGSSKIKKARDLGIPILTPEKLEDML